MNGRGVIGILGAAALLTVAGCDFWDNLVGEKKIAATTLSLRAIDAYTGEAVSGNCADAARGVQIPLNGGMAKLEGIATGDYSLDCESLSYFPINLKFRMTTSGRSDSLRFIRKGGDDWYLDETRAVALPFDGDAIRFPARLDWTAQPADTTGRFRYEWTFASATRLNWAPVAGRPMDKHFLPAYKADANAAIGVHNGPDTLCLTVYSRMLGAQAEYLVGKSCRDFEWIRNKLPVISLDPDSVVATYKVGCGPNPVRPRIVAHDSDGLCRSIRLFAGDELSSLGKLNLTLPCKESQFTSLPLQPPANPGDAKNAQGKFPTTLYAEITDDNNEKTYDTLDFLTYPNFAPKAKAGLKLSRKVYFQGDSVWFWWKGKTPTAPSRSPPSIGAAMARMKSLAP